jgi:hypothetical protein
VLDGVVKSTLCEIISGTESIQLKVSRFGTYGNTLDANQCCSSSPRGDPGARKSSA